MTVKFFIQGRWVFANLLMPEDIHDFMLSYDWLEAQGIDWYFDRKDIVLCGREISLQLPSSRSAVSHVLARKLVLVAPLSEQDLPMKVVQESLGTAKTDWLLEPQTLAEGIHVACVLLSDSDVGVALWLANQTRHPYTFAAGIGVGQANMVSSLATLQDDFLHILPIIASLSGKLTDAECTEAASFIKMYSQVFSRSEFDLGHTTLITHHIDTGDAKPFHQGLRHHPQVYMNVIDTEVANMEAAGVIEPACLPWASNVVVVAKHDSTPRITLDYRQLNNVTYKDSYPLPNIADCLDTFKGASHFAVLDLHSSFYQVPLAEADRDKTAFITRRRQ